MVLRNEVSLPEESELNVPEVNVSMATLRAASFHLGKHCEDVNNEFMLCRFEENDPRKCLNEGKAVTACTLDFFKKVKKSCMGEFNQYANCIDKSSGDYSMDSCRKTQGVYDQCMVEKLNIERPPFGYFTEARVHHTKRPKPPVEEKVVYPDATPALPEDYPKQAPRFGSRFFWINE